MLTCPPPLPPLQAVEAQLRAQEANAIVSQSLARQALEQKRLHEELYRREWSTEAARERSDAKAYQIQLQAQAKLLIDPRCVKLSEEAAMVEAAD